MSYETGHGNLAGLRDWAARGDDEPDDGQVCTALFVPIAESGPVLAYGDKIAVAAFQAQVGKVGAREAIIGALDGILTGLHQTVVPAGLSMPGASIAAGAASRLGEAEAMRLAGKIVTRWVVAPRIRAAAGQSNAALAGAVTMALDELAAGTPFGARPGSRLVALQSEFARLSEAFDAWVRELVAAGAFSLCIAAWRPDADPDDATIQAEAIIAGDAALASAFMPPTPDDPLGTSPRCLLTVIGQAIALARQARSTEYDWVAVQQLADTSSGEFIALLRDERLHVLDNIRI